MTSSMTDTHTFDSTRRHDVEFMAPTGLKAFSLTVLLAASAMLAFGAWASMTIDAGDAAWVETVRLAMTVTCAVPSLILLLLAGRYVRSSC